MLVGQIPHLAPVVSLVRTPPLPMLSPARVALRLLTPHNPALTRRNQDLAVFEQQVDQAGIEPATFPISAEKCNHYTFGPQMRPVGIEPTLWHVKSVLHCRSATTPKLTVDLEGYAPSSTDCKSVVLLIELQALEKPPMMPT